MKFVTKKEKILNSALEYTDSMRSDFDGIIEHLFGRPKPINDLRSQQEIQPSSHYIFKLFEGTEINALKETLLHSEHHNRYYLILLVKTGLLIDSLDKMMNKVRKETFGSQCLKETIAIVKNRISETQHPKLCTYLIFQIGKINYLMRDFRQAYKEFKIGYEVSEIFFDKYFLMKSAEWLGKTCSMIKMYHEAVSHFTLMLHLAWILNNKKYENRAYDYLGLQHFYLGEIQVAKKYHQKMIEGQFEGQNSEMIVLTRDLYTKKESEKKHYYKSRDSVLRYQIISQIIHYSAKDYDNDNRETNKTMEEGELPSIDSVIMHKGKDDGCKLKVSITHYDILDSIKENGLVKIQLKIKSKMFKTGIQSHDLKFFTFKDLTGNEEIQIEVFYLTAKIVKNIRLKEIPKETQTLISDIHLSEINPGMKGSFSFDLNLSKLKEK